MNILFVQHVWNKRNTIRNLPLTSHEEKEYTVEAVYSNRGYVFKYEGGSPEYLNTYPEILRSTRPRICIPFSPRGAGREVFYVLSSLLEYVCIQGLFENLSEFICDKNFTICLFVIDMEYKCIPD